MNLLSSLNASIHACYGELSRAGVTGQILNALGTVQQVEASIPAGSNGRRFIRLKVE